jgi:hypothetical protein
VTVPDDETGRPDFWAGSPEPTPEKVDTARRLLHLHREIGLTRNNFCSWCLKPWPCPDVRWSKVVLTRLP